MDCLQSKMKHRFDGDAKAIGFENEDDKVTVDVEQSVTVDVEQYIAAL